MVSHSNIFPRNACFASSVGWRREEGRSRGGTEKQILSRIPELEPRSKEQLLWDRTFQNVEELGCALAEFRERYNQRWIVRRLGYLTPAQARQQLLALGAAA